VSVDGEKSRLYVMNASCLRYLSRGEAEAVPSSADGGKPRLGQFVRVAGPCASGEFKKLFLCRNEETGRLAAWLEAFPGKERDLREETEVLRGLSHPNLPQLLAASESVMVLPLFPRGDLVSIITSGKASARLGLRVWADILDALLYLRSRRILHGDVCPWNVLVGRSGRFVLTDFGGAVVLQAGAPLRKDRVTRVAFCPPEAVFPMKLLWDSYDTYSLALTVVAFLSGVDPFGDVPILETAYCKLEAYVLFEMDGKEVDWQAYWPIGFEKARDALREAGVGEAAEVLAHHLAIDVKRRPSHQSTQQKIRGFFTRVKGS